MVKNSVNDISDVKNTMNAFYKIIDIRSEYFLNELRELLLAHYRSFFQVEDVSAYREYFINTIADVLNVKNPLDMSLDIKQLTTIINYAKQLEKASKKPAQYILNIINTTQQYIDNTINFEKYKELYLTKENEIAKKFLQDEVFKQEAFRVYEIQQYLLNKDIFQNTVAFFDLSMNFEN
jgi:hypothetical protein